MALYLGAIFACFVGIVFGYLLGDDVGYERGCQETHDYYHSRGVRR